MEREAAGMVVSQGVTQTHVTSWEEKIRNLRIKKCALDNENRAIDKIQCYSKMLTCLTKEGMASNGEPRGAYFAQEEQWDDPKPEKTGKKKSGIKPASSASEKKDKSTDNSKKKESFQDDVRDRGGRGRGDGRVVDADAVEEPVEVRSDRRPTPI